MSAGFGAPGDTVDVLEAAIGIRGHLVGDRFTMADLLAAAYIGWYLQFKLLEPRDNLIRYAQLHRARPAAVRADTIDEAELARIKAAQD